MPPLHQRIPLLAKVLPLNPKEQKQPCPRVKLPKFGSTATAKERCMGVMRTCAISEGHGHKRWKQDSGYHRHSLAETTMFRLKTIVGGDLRARKFDNQAVELFIKCAALNRMIQVAKPDSYQVEV